MQINVTDLFGKKFVIDLSGDTLVENPFKSENIGVAYECPPCQQNAQQGVHPTPRRLAFPSLPESVKVENSLPAVSG